MSYTLNNASTLAQVDAILANADARKRVYELRKLSLENQITNFSTNVVDLPAQLAAINAKLDGFNAALAVLPEGDEKNELIQTINLLENRQITLEKRTENNGVENLMDKQLDLANAIDQLANVNELITEATARRTELVSQGIAA